MADTTEESLVEQKKMGRTPNLADHETRAKSGRDAVGHAKT